MTVVVRLCCGRRITRSRYHGSNPKYRHQSEAIILCDMAVCLEQSLCLGLSKPRIVRFDKGARGSPTVLHCVVPLRVNDSDRSNKYSINKLGRQINRNQATHYTELYLAKS